MITSNNCSQASYAGYSLMLRQGILDVLTGPVESRPGVNLNANRVRTPATARRCEIASVKPAAVSTKALHYRMSGRLITYSATAQDLLDLVDGLWHPFRSPGEPSRQRLKIRASRHKSGYTLQTGNFFDSRLDSELQLKGRIQRTIVETVYRERDWLAVLHAGAVSCGGGTLALLGSTRAGKSTLIAGLTRSGFDYFSDDCVPVSFADHHACSVPTVLSLRAGSWPVLAGLIPELAEIDPLQRGRERIKHWFPCEPSPSVFRRQPLRWLIHPHYTPFESPGVRKLEPLEALRSFVISGSSPGPDVDSAHLQRFAGWLEGLEHYSISYRSLDEAVGQIRSIVGA